MSSSQTRKTTLYALGSNGSQQLGVGHGEDINVAERCKFLVDTPLGLNGGDAELTDTIPLQGDEEVKKLVAGGNHTLLLTTRGRVWVAGSDEAGQCGFGDSAVSVPTSESTSTSTSVEATAVWRRLEWIGGDTGDEVGKRFVTDVAAAWTVSYFVVDGKVVISCGADEKGALGLGADCTRCDKPRVSFDLGSVEGEDSRIVKISACMNHVVVLSSNGRLYGWGASRKGQLGEGLRGNKIVWKPRSLGVEGQWPWTSRQVVTGKDFTFVVGESLEQQCFMGDSMRIGVSIPVFGSSTSDLGADARADVRRSFEVSAGWTTLAILFQDGSVWSCGGRARNKIPETQTEASMSKVVLGSEHAVAILRNCNVVAWGWGEHGNCGTEADARGNVVERFNTIFTSHTDGQVVGVGAGCATSFFWSRG